MGNNQLDDYLAALAGSEQPEAEPEAPEPEAEAPGAEPEVEAEPEPEAGAAPPEPEQQQRMVPHQALHAEREARKELEREIKAYRDKLDKMNERFNDTLRIVAERQTPAKPEDKGPSFDDDPAEYLRRRVERIEGVEREYTAQQREAAEMRRVASEIAAAEASFAKATEDYPAALKFLREARLAELEVVHGAEALAHLAREEVQIAKAALQRGDNPAEIAYKMAKARGYTVAPPPPPPPVPDKAREAQQKLETIKQGQQAAPAPKAGGDGGGAIDSLEALADIDDPEEFSRAFDKMMAAARTGARRLFN